MNAINVRNAGIVRAARRGPMPEPPALRSAGCPDIGSWRPPTPAGAHRLAVAPLAAPSPVRWILIRGLPSVPVVDKISSCLYESWEALGAGNPGRAAQKMRAASEALKDLAVVAARVDGDEGLARRRLAQVTSWRLATGAMRTGLAATRMEKGRLQATADLLAILDAGAWSDIDRRWLFADEATWYPVAGEVRQHLAAASAALSRDARDAGIAEACKAGAYVRLEAARADGYARRALDGALDDLGDLIAAAKAGHRQCGQSLEGRFSGVLFALALAHRNRAAEAWVRRERAAAGYGFLAAGDILGSALEWGRDSLRPGPSAAALDCAALGRRILGGEHPDRGDVLQVVQSFGAAADLLVPAARMRETVRQACLPQR